MTFAQVDHLALKAGGLLRGRDRTAVQLAVQVSQSGLHGHHLTLVPLLTASMVQSFEADSLHLVGSDLSGGLSLAQSRPLRQVGPTML